MTDAAMMTAFWRDAGYERWYKADPAFDADIRNRFLPLYEQAIDGDLNWPDDEHAALATILLLDQLPRNMFRGTSRAFASDEMAVEAATRAIKQGFDKLHAAPLRGFFYVPFTHAENLPDQQRGEALYIEDDNREGLKWATHHREIIERFGRFPHRNAILGRTSTPEELAFLQAGGFSG